MSGDSRIESFRRFQQERNSATRSDNAVDEASAGSEERFDRLMRHRSDTSQNVNIEPQPGSSRTISDVQRQSRIRDDEIRFGNGRRTDDDFDTLDSDFNIEEEIYSHPLASTTLRHQSNRYQPYGTPRRPKVFENGIREDPNEPVQNQLEAMRIGARPSSSTPVIHLVHNRNSSVSRRLAQANPAFIPIQTNTRRPTQTEMPFTVQLCILVSPKAFRIPCKHIVGTLNSFGLGMQFLTISYGTLKYMEDQLRAAFPVLTSSRWQAVVGPKKPFHSELPGLQTSTGLNTDGLPELHLWWKKTTQVLYIRPLEEFTVDASIHELAECELCYFGEAYATVNYTKDAELQVQQELQPFEQQEKLDIVLKRRRFTRNLNLQELFDDFYKSLDTTSDRHSFRNPILVEQRASLVEILSLFSVVHAGLPTNDFVRFKFKNSEGAGIGPHIEVMTMLRKTVAERCFENHGGVLTMSPSLYEMAGESQDNVFNKCFVVVGTIIARIVANGGRGPCGLHPALKQAILFGSVKWDDFDVLTTPVEVARSTTVPESTVVKTSAAITLLQKWIQSDEVPGFQDKQVIQAACMKFQIDCELFRRSEQPKNLLARLLAFSILKPFAREIHDMRLGLQKHGILEMVGSFPHLANYVFPEVEKVTAAEILDRVKATPPEAKEKIRTILEFMNADESALKQLLTVWSGRDYLDETLKFYEDENNHDFIVHASTCASVITARKSATEEELFLEFEEMMRNPVYNAV